MNAVLDGWYPAPAQLRLTLIWTQNTVGAHLDLDLSVLMLGADDKLPDNEHFIFYNNLRSPDGSTALSEEIFLPGGNGLKDLTLNLSKVDPLLQSILVVATVHLAAENRHAFGTSPIARLSVEDLLNNETLLRYDLNGDFHAETGLEILRFRRESNGWHWKSMGIPSAGGLAGFISRYK